MLVTWGIGDRPDGLAGRMFDDSLRPAAHRALAPVRRPLGAVPPWVLTVTGLVVGLAAAGAAASGWWGPALVGWWANRVLDGLDGEIARAQGRASRLGGLLDLSADVAVYAALPLGVATGIDTIEAWQAAAALLAACYLNITTVTVLGGFAQDSDVDRVALPVGLVEGGETIVLYSLVLVGGSWRVELLAVSAALIALGAVIRLVTTVRPGSLG